MFKKLRDLFFTKDFYKGIVFELTLFVASIAAVVWSALRIPLHANGYDDQVGTAAFLMMGVVGVASALFVRSATIAAVKSRLPDGEVDEEQAARANKIIVLIFTLPVAAYLILLPWILGGAFNDERMGTAASAFLLFLLAVLMMPLLGVLAAAFVIFPIEWSVRGVIRMIRTRGKEWVQLAIGLFGLVILGFIAAGSLAVHAYDTGQVGSIQAFLAIIGVPGRYDIKNETLLWVARGLFIVFVGTLLVGKYIASRTKSDDQASAKTEKDE